MRQEFDLSQGRDKIQYSSPKREAMKTKSKSTQEFTVKKAVVFILVVVLYVLVKFGFS